MTHHPTPRSDTKLLLAVAALVVAGAAGIAMLAGLAVRDDRATYEPTAVATSLATSVPVEEGVAQPASLQRPADSSLAIEVAAPATPAFEIDPAADPRREGDRAFHAGAWIEATAYYRAEAAARPEVASTWYMLSLALWRSDDLDGAVEAMRRAAELDDRSVRTLVNLSRIHNARGEPEAALDAAERASALDPESAAATYQSARSLYNLGRVGDAVVALDRTIELDPEAGQAHNLLGLIRLQTGEDAAALASLEEAASLEPDVAYIQNNLALALERAGRLPEAAAAFRRAVELDGSHVAAATSLARVEALQPAGEPEEEGSTAVAQAETGPTIP